MKAHAMESQASMLARSPEITVADHLKLMTPALRATVEATRRAVRTAAPAASEVACQTKPPRSNRPMWKIARYFLGETEVAAIGVFSTHAHLYFQRGTELEDGSGLLEGGGVALRSIKLRTRLDASRPEVERIVRRAFKLASKGAVRTDTKRLKPK